MEHYKNFEVDDFVWDEYFRQWVLHPTRENHAEWDAWLAKNPSRTQVVHQARQLVQSIQITEHSLSEQEIQAIVDSTLQRAEALEPHRRKWNIKYYMGQTAWIRVAASVLLLLVVGWIVNRQIAGHNVTPVSETTGIAGSHKGTAMVERTNHGVSPMLISLPDGSRITLMKGSRITYPEHFNSSVREVTMVGEAFFDIKKAPERPFIVYAGELVTKVLGTSFLITAYPSSREVTVEVKTGLVSVSALGKAFKTLNDRHEANGMILSPNQKVIFEKNEVRLVKTLVADPKIVTSDVAALHFEFEDVPVSEAFDTIAKAYGIEIRYDKNLLADCPLTAKLDTQTLHEKLTIICLAVEATYEIVDGQIIVQSKGCKN
ncbi:FecR family protein [Dyadobacter sandarakinus]|uniref:FecR domain-containing protein n=1 Tax=Dyadobacter sandarakinus TaxID=2747268 RepID=A0ABX7ICR3_9BACT|nr:FecR family protein [Dyadobacter sandarakinus]QRR03252.1 FecR domain-containing protein [Dyadobacter sandarakinus]